MNKTLATDLPSRICNQTPALPHPWMYCVHMIWMDGLCAVRCSIIIHHYRCTSICTVLYIESVRNVFLLSLSRFLLNTPVSIAVVLPDVFWVFGFRPEVLHSINLLVNGSVRLLVQFLVDRTVKRIALYWKFLFLNTVTSSSTVCAP